MNRIWGVSAVVAALLLGACGSSSSTISRATYLKRADIICKRFNDRTKALAQPKSAAETKQYIQKGSKNALTSIEKLRGLAKPDADAAKIATLYDDVEEAYKDLESLSAEELSDTAVFKPFIELNARAKALGFKQCGGG